LWGWRLAAAASAVLQFTLAELTPDMGVQLGAYEWGLSPAGMNQSLDSPVTYT